MTETTDQSPVAIISGSNGSIGIAVARGFLKLGFRLVLLGRQERPTSINLSRRKVVYINRTYGNESWAEEAAQVAVDSYGRVDSLVTCAGGVSSFGSMESLTIQDWASAYRDNVIDTVDLLRAVVPHISKQGGSVVFVSSFVASAPGLHNPHYSSAKAALNHLVQFMARALSSCKINVNAVSPSYTLTSGLLKTLNAQAEKNGLDPNIYVQDRLRQMAEASPLGRLLTAEEVANVVLFLATSSKVISGQNIIVDAGLSLHRGINQ